jgi:hypothetical protein
MLMDDVTLQINISPGDIKYAGLTVPALVRQHSEIKKRLLVVDCCRPGRTKIMDPDVRFPLEQFEQNVARITEIANRLLADKIVSDVYFLRPGDPLIASISKKYLRGLYKTTHSAGGTANMSYWAGIELPDTKYVLHYDGDMLLYQKTGYNWVNEAITETEQNQSVVIAVPRLCPPAAGDAPSLHEGRPYASNSSCWVNDWFSTRQFLLNKHRFEKYLPLVGGKVMIELLLRKYGNRAFPIDPEILMFKSIGNRGCKRLILKNEDAWLLHPVNKTQAYIDKLPQIIGAISAGKYPPAQSGHEDLNLDAWLEFV